MKRNLFLMAITLFMIKSAVAQTKNYYQKSTVETDDATVTIERGVSNEKYFRYKITIVNKTNDYLIYKPAESKLVANGKEAKSKPKVPVLVVAPAETGMATIAAYGPELNTPAAAKCTFTIDGLYRLTTEGNIPTTPDFQLPVSTKAFIAGGFNVQNTTVYKQSEATKVDFIVTYNGKKSGFIIPNKATVSMPDNKEYLAKPAEPPVGLIVLEKGKKQELSLSWDRMPGGRAMDMQVVPMSIKWHETFCDATPIQSKTLTFNLELDPKKMGAGAPKDEKEDKEDKEVKEEKGGK